MNLSVIFHGDWEVYAHRDPVSGKRELLQEHIARCEKYRIRISQERKLLKIEENFLTKLGLDKDDFAGKLVKEMIDAVILFHDLGKGTPAFQKNKMGNPNTIPTKYWGDDSSHSFLSAFLYLDFYLYEIKNGFNKVEKEQKKALIALAWELSYVIAKHHSNFESMEAYLKNFQLKAEELLRKWKEEPVPGFSQLRFFYEIPIAKSINQYFMCRKAFGRTENDIVHYFFIRLEYSILVACDYYATTEFNSGFEMDCFGKADASKFREIYERSPLMESIRKYGKESYPRKKWDGKEKINILRNELFLEAEENLKAAEEDSIYFVEAPTGSGKSNLALNLSLKFLEHADKVFEIYPFNTLAEQNRHTLETIFGKTEAINDIAVVNSLTPIRGRGNVEENPEKYYKEALLDRQFLNYPFILSSHVTFFRTLFGTGKEDIMSFFQLLNSVVVLDEIQSYRNAIWTEIMIFLNSCAGLMNMKIIIMSATLPDLSQLVDGKCNVVKLIRNPEKYTLHPTFANRVICNYELLQEEITLDRLRRHVLENMQLREKSGAKILITFIKNIKPDVICMVDNCYGEFVEEKEPLEVGADMIVGSLIKNPGGGIAPTGGYIAGRADLVELCAHRLSAPGVGGEIGCTLDMLRGMYLGLYYAPGVVCEALKTSVYAACLFELLGYAATPAYGAQRNDIITSVETGSPEGMVALCGGVQAGSPVDSFAAPEPGDMPGYEDPVIMAAGAFTMGSSIELSADGPLRAPYTVYMQGGLNFAAARAGVLLGADRMLRLRRSE